MDDLFQILAVLGFILFSFISAAKKKGEAQKEEADAPLVTSDAGASDTKPATGLQARLDAALRKMEQRIEAERAGGGNVQVGPDRSQTPSDPDAVANEIGRLSAEALYDRAEVGRSGKPDPGFQGVPESPELEVRFDSIEPDSVDPNRIEQEDFDDELRLPEWSTSSSETSPNYSPLPALSSTFKVAHGLHYNEGVDPLSTEVGRPVEFHQAHGLHYNESHDQHPSMLPPPRPDGGPRFTAAEMKRAVVMAEILGPPRSARMFGGRSS